VVSKRWTLWVNSGTTAQRLRISPKGHSRNAHLLIQRPQNVFACPFDTPLQYTVPFRLPVDTHPRDHRFQTLRRRFSAVGRLLVDRGGRRGFSRTRPKYPTGAVYFILTLQQMLGTTMACLSGLLCERTLGGPFELSRPGESAESRIALAS
jgi:hypothetical protein